MDKRILMMSHKTDIDGMGSIVLSKVAFNNVTYLLFENPLELSEKFIYLLEKNYLDNFNQVYICDLSLNKTIMDLINNNLELKNKIKIFDHHQKAIEDGLDKYDFCTIIEKDNNKKRCGTDLFYDYLCNNSFILKNKASDEFTELTRLEDVWEWKKHGEFGIKAHDLTYLFNTVKQEKYIEIMVDKIKNNDLNFSKEELLIINNIKSKLNKKMDELLKNALFLVDDNNIEFITLFADYEDRNDITDYIENKYNYKYKYAVIVSLNKGDYGQKSYRSIDININVNDICKKYGGGGHPGAAAVLITKNQREIINGLNLKEGLKYIVNCGYIKE